MTKLKWLRIAGYSVVAIAVVFVILITLFLKFGYTNDQRYEHQIDPAGLTAIQFDKERIGSVLTKELNATYDVNGEQVQLAKRRFLELAQHFVMAKSERFVHEGQVYIPVGRYPERIEGRDALIIPPGAELRIAIDPKVMLKHQINAGEPWLRFFTTGFIGSYQLENPDTGEQTDVIQMPEPLEPTSLWYRMVERFLIVNRTWESWDWRETGGRFTFGKPYRLRCISTDVPCVVSNPVLFLKNTSQSTAITTARRNFIVIVIDTLRGDAVQPQKMPELAQFASSGVNFVNTIAPGNMTSPSTNALLSCQKPTDLGDMAFSYTLSPEDRETFYKKNTPSWPEVLRRSGYETAQIGNVSVVSEVVGVGVNHGFEETISIEVEGYDTPRIADEAIRWLRDHGGAPFLLYVHFNGPHAPYRAPLSYLLKRWPGFAGVTSLGSALKWLYDGETAYSDAYVARVLAAIKQLNLSSNTTIVLTSDHGDQMTDRRFTGNEAGPAYVGAYFDHGATMLNDEIKVPLLVAGPGIQEGIQVDDWVQTNDIGPTILRAAGLDVPTHCRGQSLLGFVKGNAPVPDKNRTLGSEGFRHRAILFGNRYKYIRGYATNDRRLVFANSWNRSPSQVFFKEELYDLAADPEEFNNLANFVQATLNDQLLTRAREVFKEYYNVSDGYELVVDAPKTAEVEVRLSEGSKLRLADVAGPGSRDYRAAGRSRHLLLLDPWDLSPPEVKVAGQLIPITLTAARLPIPFSKAAVAELPLEVAGEGGLLGESREPSAYLRKIEPNDLQVRRIVTGNPMFDKVLREWGYLNDN